MCIYISRAATTDISIPDYCINVFSQLFIYEMSPISDDVYKCVFFFFPTNCTKPKDVF